MALAYVASLGGGAAQAVPPPPMQAGVDCAAPVYASDRLVCDDPVLLELDRANTRTLAGQAALVPGIETNDGWFRRRSRCAFEADHRGCLIDAYRDRALVLSAASAAPSADTPVGCGGTWSARKVRLSTPVSNAVRITGDGRLVAIATGRLPGSPWKPAVAYAATGRTFIFTPLDAAPIRCVAEPVF